MWTTIAEVKAANEKIGHCWFSDETIRHWNTSIHTDILYGRYFITSEDNYHRTQKLFSIREVGDRGQVSTLEFQQWQTLRGAREYPDEMAIDEMLEEVGERLA